MISKDSWEFFIENECATILLERFLYNNIHAQSAIGMQWMAMGTTLTICQEY